MSISRIVIAGLLLVTAGCASAPDDVDDQNTPEVSEEVRALHLPFDEYELSRVDRQTIAYAEDILTRACMRGEGMDWEMLPPLSHDPDPLIRRRYGVIESEVAARYGYHRQPLPPELSAREVVWQKRNDLPLAERHMVYGSDGEGGCRAEARGQLRKGIPGIGENRLYDYTIEVFRASQNAPEVVEVFRAWSACMESEGFDYADPLRTLEDPAWQSEHPSAQEVAVAEADVRCKRNTDLVAVWSGTEVRIQRDTIRSHPNDFDGFARAKSLQLDAARQVIDHGSIR